VFQAFVPCYGPMYEMGFEGRYRRKKEQEEQMFFSIIAIVPDRGAACPGLVNLAELALSFKNRLLIGSYKTEFSDEKSFMGDHRPLPLWSESKSPAY